jgi:hypothetical protein
VLSSPANDNVDVVGGKLESCSQRNGRAELKLAKVVALPNDNKLSEARWLPPNSLHDFTIAQEFAFNVSAHVLARWIYFLDSWAMLHVADELQQYLAANVPWNEKASQRRKASQMP